MIKNIAFIALCISQLQCIASSNDENDKLQPIQITNEENDIVEHVEERNVDMLDMHYQSSDNDESTSDIISKQEQSYYGWEIEYSPREISSIVNKYKNIEALAKNIEPKVILQIIDQCDNIKKLIVQNITKDLLCYVNMPLTNFAECLVEQDNQIKLSKNCHTFFTQMTSSDNSSNITQKVNNVTLSTTKPILLTTLKYPEITSPATPQDIETIREHLANKAQSQNTNEFTDDHIMTAIHIHTINKFLNIIDLTFTMFLTTDCESEALNEFLARHTNYIYKKSQENGLIYFKKNSEDNRKYVINNKEFTDTQMSSLYDDTTEEEIVDTIQDNCDISDLNIEENLYYAVKNALCSTSDCPHYGQYHIFNEYCRNIERLIRITTTTALQDKLTANKYEKVHILFISIFMHIFNIRIDKFDTHLHNSLEKLPDLDMFRPLKTLLNKYSDIRWDMMNNILEQIKKKLPSEIEMKRNCLYDLKQWKHKQLQMFNTVKPLMSDWVEFIDTNYA